MAATAALADEREVKRLSQLPRAVVAFRKPAEIEPPKGRGGGKRKGGGKSRGKGRTKGRGKGRR